MADLHDQLYNSETVAMAARCATVDVQYCLIACQYAYITLREIAAMPQVLLHST